MYSVIPWVSSPSRRGGDQEFACITFSFVRCIMHLEPILSRALIMFEKTMMPSFWSLALNRIVRRSCTLAAAGSGSIEHVPAFDYYRFSRSSPICTRGEVVALGTHHADWAQMSSRAELRNLARDYTLIPLREFWRSWCLNGPPTIVLSAFDLTLLRGEDLNFVRGEGPGGWSPPPRCAAAGGPAACCSYCGQPAAARSSSRTHDRHRSAYPLGRARFQSAAYPWRAYINAELSDPEFSISQQAGR